MPYSFAADSFRTKKLCSRLSLREIHFCTQSGPFAFKLPLWGLRGYVLCSWKFLVDFLLVTRNSSGDEIANVNFLYDNIVHALQNTIDSCINSATDRRSYVLSVKTQVFEKQWNNALYRPLRRSRSFKVTDFGTNRKRIYDFLLVINTKLPPIVHRFQVMADYWSNFR